MAGDWEVTPQDIKDGFRLSGMVTFDSQWIENLSPPHRALIQVLWKYSKDHACYKCGTVSTLASKKTVRDAYFLSYKTTECCDGQRTDLYQHKFLSRFLSVKHTYRHEERGVVTEWRYLCQSCGFVGGHTLHEMYYHMMRHPYLPKEYTLT